MSLLAQSKKLYRYIKGQKKVTIGLFSSTYWLKGVKTVQNGLFLNVTEYVLFSMV